MLRRGCGSLLVVVACFGAGCADGDGVDAGSGEVPVVASRFAGIYRQYDAWTNGAIFEMVLRPDSTFYVHVRGEYGCEVYAGYECPSSWPDGRTGWTDVRGRWRTPNGRDGVELLPEGDGRPSDPIPMTLTFHEGKVTVAGTIKPNRAIGGEMDVDGLWGKTHSATVGDLDGEWRVTNRRVDGSHPRLDGAMVAVSDDEQHTVTFDASDKTFGERLSSDGPPKKPVVMHFDVIGAATGSGPGVVFMDETMDSYHTAILSRVTRQELEIEVLGGRMLRLARVR
jgi:hypothetical protein